MKKGLILIAWVLLTSLSGGATGIISGTVTDARYGDAMIGAYVRIVELDKGVITDIDGVFSITLKEGVYTVEVTFEGYGKFEKRGVRVDNNGTTLLNVTMTESAQLIDEVVIRAKANTSGDLAIITARKKSAQIFDGIPAEEMSRQGSNNAADAVNKVTGVSIEGGKYVYVRGLGDRYSKTTLNGSEVPSLDPERNGVQMDLFPGDMISNIKVYKTFSPQLPGDFSGGLVDIGTKDFPGKFTLSAGASYGFNTQVFLNKNFLTYRGSSTDWLGYDNGTRDIPDEVKGQDVPSVVPTATYDNSKLEGMTKSFNNVMFAERKTGGINQSYSFAVGNQFNINNRAFGYYLGMSYRRSLSHYGSANEGRIERYHAPGGNMLTPVYLLNDENSKENVITGLFLNTHYRINSHHKIGLNVMQNISGTKSTRMLQGQWAEDGSVNPDRLFYSQTLQFLERRMNTFQLKGEHEPEMFPVKIDWMTTFTLSAQDEPDLRYLAYDIVIDEQGDTSYRISKNAYGLPSRFFRTMRERNLDQKINLHFPLDSLLGNGAELVVGVSFLTKERTFRENRYDYFQTNDFDGNLQNFFAPDNMTITPYDPANTSTYLIAYPGDDQKNSYDGAQRIIGTYAMLDFPVITDRLKFSGGLRFEQTNMEVASLKTTLKKGMLYNNDLLPAFNLTYVVKENKQTFALTNLRAAYSKTIARPTFRELAPFPSFFFTGDFVLIGNPDLERTVIQNFDLRYEIFPKRGEYIAVSAFYKSFENPIEKTQNPVASNLEITFKNVGNAVLYGVEFEAVKSLSNLFPKVNLVKDMVIGINAALMKSEVKIDSLEYRVRSEIDPEVASTRPMYSQSPYLVNGYMTYDNDSLGMSVTVNYSVFGKRLALVSQGRLPDVYEMPAPSLGLTAFKKIGKNFQLSLSAQNLLNPVSRMVHNYEGKEYTYSSYKRGTSYSIGMKYNF